ncbi:MAG: ATP-binding protein, partial [Crocinitomicaceae bacterium]|nr:ATP-binding protein [Crocinitomicaceae bacterium]
VDLSLHEYGGLVHFDPETENACINGDSFHLINAVTNVLDNSIKYRRESLKIAIKLTESPSEYLISIKDNGIGMTKRSVQLAFDEFYREETGNIHSQRGFGIGLSYVKSIIEAHNGSVRIESTANQGTTVQIYIPKK